MGMICVAKCSLVLAVPIASLWINYQCAMTAHPCRQGIFNPGTPVSPGLVQTPKVLLVGGDLHRLRLLKQIKDLEECHARNAKVAG